MATYVERYQAPLADERASHVGGHDNMSTLEGLLGPVQIPPQYDARSRLPRTDYPLEEIYKDHIEYLGRSISAIVLSTRLEFMLTKIMPVRVTDQMYMAFEKSIPDRGIVPQASEKTAPHNVTSREESRSVTLKRYRIGFKASIEGLKTAKGQFTLALHAVTAAMMLRETMEVVALDAMVREKQYYAEMARRHGDKHPNPSAAAAADWVYFDALNKYERGIYMLIDAVRYTMSKYNVQPDHVILSEGMRSKIASTPAQLEYYRAGAVARQHVEMGGASMGMSISGLDVSIAKEIYQPRGGRLLAPLRRSVHLNSFFVQTDRTTELGPEQYTSASRTVAVLDASKAPTGDWTEIDLRAAKNACARYDQNSNAQELVPELYELARTVAAELESQGLSSENGYVDPDLYRRDDGSYGVAQLYGQKDELALPDSVVASTAASIAHVIRSHLAPGDAEALVAGQRAIDRIYARTASAADEQFARLVATSGVVQNGVVSGSKYGGPRLPTEAPVIPGAPGAPGPRALQNYEPFGFGSWPGLLEIADLAQQPVGTGARAYVSENLIEVADRAAMALKGVFDVVRPLFPAHPMFVPSAVPEYLRGDDERATALAAFAQNFVDRFKPALYVPAGAGATDRAVTDYDDGAVTDANDVAYLRSVQSVVRAYPDATLLAAFKSTAAVDAFLEQYARSAFARAFADVIRGSVRPEDELKFTSLLTSDAVYQTLNSAANANDADIGRIASLLSHVVRVVNGAEVLPSGDVATAVDAWLSRGVPPRAAASLEGSAAQYVLTRLVAPYDRVATTALRMASPLEPSRVFTGSAQDLAAFKADSRADANGLSLNLARGGGAAAFYDDLESFGAAGAAAGPSYELNANLQQRYARVSASERDPLRRAAAQLFLLARNTGAQIDAWLNNNVRVPDDFIGYRPNHHLQTRQIIFIKTTGGDFGFMAMREIDVQRGHDPIAREYQFNVTAQFAPAIISAENYLVQRDAEVCRYFGGYTTVPFTPETWNAEEDEAILSVIYAKCGAGSLRGTRAPSSVHDIRGRFSPDVMARTDETSARIDAARPHVDGALYMSMRYRLATEMPVLHGDEHDWVHAPYRALSPVSFQEAQKTWDAATRRLEANVRSAEPFGPDVGPGFMLARNSELPVFTKGLNAPMRA